jgi:hypothetical protein
VVRRGDPAPPTETPLTLRIDSDVITVALAPADVPKIVNGLNGRGFSPWVTLATDRDAPIPSPGDSLEVPLIGADVQSTPSPAP